MVFASKTCCGNSHIVENQTTNIAIGLNKLLKLRFREVGTVLALSIIVLLSPTIGGSFKSVGHKNKLNTIACIVYFEWEVDVSLSLYSSFVGVKLSLNIDVSLGK